VNERFVSVIINKDVDFTPTRNAPFELVDAFTYRTASSKTLLPLRVKRSPSKFSTDLRRKKMRTFYKWSAPRYPKLSNPKRAALYLGMVVQPNIIEEQA